MKKSAVRGQKSSKQQKKTLSTIRFDRESDSESSNDDGRPKYLTHETLPQTELGNRENNLKYMTINKVLLL